MPPTGKPFATGKQKLRSGSAASRGNSLAGAARRTLDLANSSRSRVCSGKVCQICRATERQLGISRVGRAAAPTRKRISGSSNCAPY